MRCIVHGPNLKVFGRAIHALAKIGDEIYFEARSDGMSIGTVNSSRCAYMNFSFKITFFQKFSFRNKSKSDREDDEESIKCKVYTKSCLAVFKSLVTLEKTVDKCVILMDVEEDRFIFQLHCRHGLMKTYNLTFIESEKLDAIFTLEDCPNSMIIQSRLFTEVVGNFQLNAEEMSLQLFQDKAIVTNHVLETAENSNNVLRTEVELLSEEFDEYNVVSTPVKVIFCLKEFRALLFFCEGPNLQFSTFVRGAGEPIVFVVDSDPAFDAHLVLATVFSGDQSNNSTAAAGAAASVSRKRVGQSTSKLEKKKGKSSEREKKVLFDVSNSREDEEPSRLDNESHVIADATLARTFADDDGDDDDDDVGAENRVTNSIQTPTGSYFTTRVQGNLLGSQDSCQTSSARSSCRRTDRRGPGDELPGVPTPRTKRKAESNDDRGSSLVERFKGRSGSNASESQWSNRPKPTTVFQPIILEDDDDDDNDGQALETLKQVRQTLAEDSRLEDQDDDNDAGRNDEDDDDDVVPGTPPEEPPTKRFRSLFFGLSQSQSQEDSIDQSAVESRKADENYAVLAEDSEDEG